jgi:hypothetical protein
MRPPVVRSSNPAEVQLVVGLLVREINALEDQIKTIKTKADTVIAQSSSSSISTDATLQGPAGPQGPQGLQGPSGADGSFEAHEHPEFYDLNGLNTWFGTKTTDQLTEGDTNKYLSTDEIDSRIETTWMSLVTGWSAEPFLNTTITDGEVWTYTFTTDTGTVTYYRLVPSGSEDDAFYTTFVGGVLSGLISAKPITI